MVEALQQFFFSSHFSYCAFQLQSFYLTSFYNLCPVLTYKPSVASPFIRYSSGCYRCPIRLILIFFLGYWLFLWRDSPLELPTPPFSVMSSSFQTISFIDLQRAWHQRGCATCLLLRKLWNYQQAWGWEFGFRSAIDLGLWTACVLNSDPEAKDPLVVKIATYYWTTCIAKSLTCIFPSKPLNGPVR